MKYRDLTIALSALALCAAMAQQSTGRPDRPGSDKPCELYRLCSDSNHLYTTSKKEAARAQGYHSEGSLGRVYASPQRNTVPLYRFDNPRDHFYTCSMEEGQAAARWQYSLVGTAAHVYSKQLKGTVPVYRHFNGSSHFYTANKQESDSIPASGWKLEGVAFYVLPE